MRDFNCPQCGSKKFLLHRTEVLKVDFSREGAIKGHPYLSYLGDTAYRLSCSTCMKEITGEQKKAMLKEII